jgi:RES domain-containing protein
MRVYRLSKKKYVDDLSGKGAEITGGRWNKTGTKLLYTSDSRALCTAEIAVHSPIGIIPTDYYLITIDIADNVEINKLDIAELPRDWKSFPHSHTTQQIGEDFVTKKNYLVLKVPSAVVQGDYNYLINPLHKDIEKVKIVNKEVFSFDERLFR